MRYLISFLAVFFAGVAFADKNHASDSYNYTRAIEAIQNENYEEAEEYFGKEVKENPHNGYAHQWLAVIHSINEDYGMALSSIDKALKYLPKKDKEYRSAAYQRRADIYHELGRDEDALADYAAAIRETPDDIDIYKERGQIYYELGNYDMSDLDYRMMTELDPGNVVGYMGLGRNASNREDYEGAIKQFDYVLKLANNYSQGYSFRGESLFNLKKYTEAADDVVKALDIDRDDLAWEVMNELADSAFTAIKIKLKVQVSKSPNEMYWPYCLGVINERVQNYDKAIEYYKKCLDKEAEPTFARRLSVCYNSLGCHQTSLDYIDYAIELDSTHYEYYLDRAEVLCTLGRLDDAESEYTRVLNKFPEYSTGYANRGFVRFCKRNYEDALDDYETSMLINPDNASVTLMCGTMKRLLCRGDRGVTEFNRTLEIDTVPGNRRSAVYAYYYLGDEDKAVATLEENMAKGIDNVNYSAACLYSLLGQKDKAIDALRKELEISNAVAWVFKYDTDLDNIRYTEEFAQLMAEYDERIEQECGCAPNDEVKYELTEVEVPFSKDGGVTKVKCNINGLPLHFVFDTGASDVTISSVEASFMFKHGYLKPEDISGKQSYITANGDISEGTVVNLRNVDFGGLSLDNIKAAVIGNQKAPLLLGQSVLQRLGKIEIDNSNQLLKITYKRPLE